MYKPKDVPTLQHLYFADRECYIPNNTLKPGFPQKVGLEIARLEEGKEIRLSRSGEVIYIMT